MTEVRRPQPMSSLAAPAVVEVPDRRDHVRRAQLVRRVCAEFEEMPCLRLTSEQAQRLFGLRPDICTRVLMALSGERVLWYAPDGQYSVLGHQ